MTAALEKVQSGEPVLGIGLMSGTSADGIDAAAVELWQEDGRLRGEVRAFHTTPYPGWVRELLFECFEERISLSRLCVLNGVVGELFARAAEQVRDLASGGPELAFVASHGQTVWHQPEPLASLVPKGRSAGGLDLRGTLQIGEPARIAERLRVPVVADFRQQDVALGGQGAPLVPYVDYLLFAHPVENRAAQNLGGIGNVTYLRAGGAPEAVIAFDTGPGNALMDAAAALATGGRLQFDADGHLAQSAPPDEDLLRELLREPFLAHPPPKSTGRELFSARRVAELARRGYGGAALVSTLTQFTVETVARAYRDWLGPVDTVILGGGGARNPELVRRLADALSPARVAPAEEFGLNSEAKEALAFAVLGYETLRGRPSNVPSATGAARPAVQGKVCFP